MSAAEKAWIQQLERASDSRAMLATFAKHYHYFSIHQVIAFTGLFRAIASDDRDSLAALAGVLYEELGGGDAAAVHSRLFERFVRACGVDPTSLPLRREDVAPGVVAYVEMLRRSFLDDAPAEAFAAYVFLESSAVETYGPLLATLRRTAMFTDDDLIFFIRHATVEPDHKAAAEELAKRYVNNETREMYQARITLLADQWEAFWQSIAAVTEQRG